MAGKPRFTVEQVAQALEESRGLVTVAARKLQCDQQTIRNYATRHERVQRAMIDSRERLLDSAEARLVEAVERHADIRAIFFVLKTLGKNRGYVERVEQTGADGGPIQHENKLDLGKLNDDELHTLEDLVARSAPDSTGVEST